MISFGSLEVEGCKVGASRGTSAQKGKRDQIEHLARSRPYVILPLLDVVTVKSPVSSPESGCLTVSVMVVPVVQVVWIADSRIPDPLIASDRTGVPVVKGSQGIESSDSEQQIVSLVINRKS